MKVSKSTVQRVAYEAERALLLCLGRGGMPEWQSVPESVRTLDVDIHPAPVSGHWAIPEQLEMRMALVKAVRDFFAPHVEET